MAILKNTKHEQFAHRVAAGESAEKAYVAIGYSKKGAAACASRLLKTAKVKARVNELKAEIAKQVVEKTAVDAAWVRSRIVEVVERSMQNAPVLDGFGRPVLIKTKKGDLVPAYTFNAKGALVGLKMLGEDVGMFKAPPVVPPDPNEPARVTNNIVNFIGAEGMLAAAKALASRVTIDAGNPRLTVTGPD